MGKLKNLFIKLIPAFALLVIFWIASIGTYGFSEWSSAPTGALPTNAAPAYQPNAGGGSSGGSSGSSVRINTPIKQGWILEMGEWYYYSGTSRSSLKKGWHFDSQDGFWYYLQLTDGKMLKGWNLIDGEWYYFNPYTPIETWELKTDGEWYYMNIKDSRPLGSMYKNEMTPDGYFVNEQGKYYVK